MYKHMCTVYIYIYIYIYYIYIYYIHIYICIYKDIIPIISTPSRGDVVEKSTHPVRLALDLGIGKDEGHALALDARADAEGFQIFEESVVVVGLRNGDPKRRSQSQRIIG